MTATAGVDPSASMVRRAAEAFSRGEYGQALHLYEQLSAQIGSASFRANIVMCQRRAGVPSPLPELTHAREPLSAEQAELLYTEACEAFQQHGQIIQPKQILDRLELSGMLRGEAELNFKLGIDGLHSLLHASPQIPPRAHAGNEFGGGNLLYVAASCLPYHTSGYTSRTHELALAINDLAPGRLTVVTRPGYPWDRHDSCGHPESDSTEYQGIICRHLKSPSWAMPLDGYLQEAASALTVFATKAKVSAIHAASNHVNSLPALIAARRLGLPFSYEMRGLWDLTRVAKLPAHENSDRFHLGMKLEALVASQADRVFVISEALGQYIRQEWGVEASKIEPLPNCINPESIVRSMALTGSKPERFTVGYAGSLVSYEGLDLLIDALKELKLSGAPIDARIIGDGPERAELERRAVAAGLSSEVQFLGRLSPEDARARLAETHAAVIPRRPAAVCRVIPPLKLAEAKALGLPVVVPDLDVLIAEVRDYSRAQTYAAGDPSSLAACLLRMARAPASAPAPMVQPNRTWRHHAAKLIAPAERAEQPRGMELPGLAPSNVLTFDLAAADPEAVVEFGSKTEDPQKAFAAAEFLLERGYVAHAVAVGESVVARQDTLQVLRRGARLFHRAADSAKASALARRLSIVSSSPSDIRLVKEIMQTAQLLRAASEPPATPLRASHSRKVINFLAFSLPYKTVGYATRSHGLAQGIKNVGWDIVPYTRPGFPRDLVSGAPAGEIPEADPIGAITYRRIAEPLRRGRTESEYMTEAVAACAEAIRRENPAVVHAASNYVTALPALIAARRAGLPFVYEVRGFWEITRTSRDEEFRNTPKFRTMKLFESALASSADHVITLTSGMREELAAEGVAFEKISVAYNGVDTDVFRPRPRNDQLAGELRISPGTTVIGYVGSFVDYEGLDDLLAAAADLKNSGRDFKLLLVGDGSADESLKQLAAELDLLDRTIFTGRVPHEEIGAYYSLIDIAPFPRKPWTVCELVSPLKPFEAMALEKLVVASDTKALTESIADGSNGLLFRKGDVGSLTATLAKAFDRGLRADIGARARRWAVEHRTWDSAGRVCNDVYSRLLTPGMSPAH